jgi:molybdate transport system permease protein
MTDTWATLLLTVQVATLATALTAVPCIALGYLLARREFFGKQLVSALVGLPLVLPPTAVGYLLLRLFAVDGWLGKQSLGFDLDLLLTWRGAVAATAVMSIPLVTRTARVSFEGIDPELEGMAQTLGHSPLRTFLHFTLPMARRGLLAALILGFTRAVGEFGATVTLAGNIPGRTQTLAGGIFSAQQVGDSASANALIAVSLVLGCGAIAASEWLSRAPKARVP